MPASITPPRGTPGALPSRRLFPTLWRNTEAAPRAPVPTKPLPPLFGQLSVSDARRARHAVVEVALVSGMTRTRSRHRYGSAVRSSCARDAELPKLLG